MVKLFTCRIEVLVISALCWSAMHGALGANAPVSPAGNQTARARAVASGCTYLVTAIPAPLGTGTVTGGGYVACNSSITVTAIPKPCYHFDGWSDQQVIVSSNLSYTFTVTRVHHLIGLFSPVVHIINTPAVPTAGGTITGGGGVPCGASTTITATANPGYAFLNWTENGAVISTATSYAFTPASNRTITANFTFTGLTITTGSLLPTGIVGSAYSQTLQATRSTPPYQWSIIAGQLPAGVALNTTTGVLAGQPAHAGTSHFRGRVAGADGQTAEQDFTLVVRDLLGPAAGTYHGLILLGDAPAFTNSGLIKLILSTNGSYIANLSIAGVASTLRGQFDSAGNATNTGPTILHLDFNGQITGTVATAALLANRAAYSLTKPCPWTGKYNCLLEPTTTAAGVPQGDGYATFTVARNGSGALAGKLGDGTAFSLMAPVSEQGTWPLYKLLYRSKGTVIGWVSFTPSNMVAVVDWFKPGISAFNTAVALTGTRLVPPASDGTWQLRLTAGDLPSDIIKTVTVAAGKVTLPPPDNYKLSLKVTPATGKFTGSFVHPVTTKPVTFTGLFLQTPENDAGGFFLGPTASGAVTLEP